jgi:zinc transport system ATP-binding protein
MISVHDLSFSYGKLQVLSGVNLEVQEGEFIAIIGPNGGGKTTLLRLMLGLLEPQEGRIEVMGRLPSEARKVVGYVPQRLSYDPQFPISAMELVLTGKVAMRYSHADREAAAAALSQVGLEGKEHAPFRSLSGGQAQRALIARAIVGSPKLLLLDESFAGIDAKGEAQLFDLLEGLRSSMTIAMVTHHLGTAIGRVDRIVAVQREVTEMTRQQVCEHYQLGLYHLPEGSQ